MLCPTRRVAVFSAIAVLALLCVLAAPGSAARAAKPAAKPAPAALPAARPRLVVLISIDQFRADYLRRFEDLYLPPQQAGGKVGGFRWLMERGAYHTDAHHDHFPLYTGPGHSIHLTGAPPYKSGIVGNEWYDRELVTKDDQGKEVKGKDRYCVEDPASPLVGVSDPAHRTGISPATLRVSTVGDELEMATGRRAQVWGLGFKDRAAVLMAGHLADGALWYDEETGAWISSAFYRHDGALPPWVAQWNAAKKVDAFFGRTWKPRSDPRATDRLFTPDSRYASDSYKLGPRSAAGEYTITGGLAQPGKDFYKAFTATPYANQYVLDTARELVAREELGRDAVPDILAINLSTNDYVGHAFGPDSAEVLDLAVAADRQLADFFNDLARAVPGGLAGVTVVVTADHGVMPIAAAAIAAGLPAGAYPEQEIRDAAETALDAALGPGDWTLALVEENLYLNLDAFAARADRDHSAAEPAVDLVSRAERIAADAVMRRPGIYVAYTRDQILAGQLPATDIARRVARSYHPKVSGEVVLVQEPFWVPNRTTGTTHGSPYAYDTSVPLLLGGAGIRPGRYTERVSTLDLAPTLAELLGVPQPSGCEGRVLAHALR